MAISVISEPAVVTLVKNKALYKLETNNYYTTGGTKFAQSFTIVNTGGGPVDTETFVLSWTDSDGVVHTLTYTFAAAPSGNYQIAVIGGDPVDDWADDNLIPILRKDYYLNRDYVITITASGATTVTVKLEAKVKGTAYDMTNTESATDMSLAAATSGVDSVTRSNFKFFLNVLMEQDFGSDDFVKIAELDADPDTVSQSIFLINKILSGAMTKNLDYPVADIPDYNESSLTWCANILKKYRCYWAESYGDTPAVQAYDAGDEKIALLGAQSEDEFYVGDFVTDFCAAGSNKRWLTNQPLTVYTNFVAQHYLYAYIPDNQSYSIKVDLNYTDDTSSSFTFDTFGSKQYNIAIVPAGYTQLDIDNEKTGSKTVRSWEVYITIGSTVKVRRREFKIDPNSIYQNRNRYYLFQNSLGGFDTLWATGIEHKNTKAALQENKKFFIDQTDYPSSNVLLPTIIISDPGYRDMIEISTGPKYKTYIDHLREFLVSPLIFEIVDSKYIPCNIVKSGIELYDDTTDQYMLTFKIARAFNNKGYSAGI